MQDKKIKGAQGVVLSERELEVLQCIHCGFKNVEIAKTLQISVDTVKRHLYNIFDKVGCSSRIELVVMTTKDPPEMAELRLKVEALSNKLGEVTKHYELLLRAINFGQVASPAWRPCSCVQAK